MPEHVSPGLRRDSSHSNNRADYVKRNKPEPLLVFKVRADSVPYGAEIARRGAWVWVARDGDVVIAVAATASECRRKYKAWVAQRPARNDKGVAVNLES